MSVQTFSKILLRGGTLLIHNENGHVIPEALDLLIEGTTISKIGRNIQVDMAEDKITRIIDCNGKIISPGFINSHQHLFQSQMKGKPTSQTLLEFFSCHNLMAAKCSPEDAFWGQLSGALECIDAGVTTAVDHANPNLAGYSNILVRALATSGLRCIFCYCPDRQTDFASPSSLDEFKTLAAAGPFGNGRVLPGYAMDKLTLPSKVIKPYFRAIRAMGTKLITSHGSGGPFFCEKPSALQLLDQHALLGPDILVSHANYPKEGDSALLAKSGAFVSTTVSTELGVGWPPVAMMPNFHEHCSLGTDGNSWGTAYMPVQMSHLLHYERFQRVQNLAKEGKWVKNINPKVGEVFNLATISGAKSIGMADELGRLAVGFKADILIFDGSSPGMHVAAEEDPVAAVVLHSSIRDLETVIIDGIVRKDYGKLLDVQVADGPNDAALGINGGQRFRWNNIFHKVLKSREVLQGKMKGIDLHAAEDTIMDLYGFDKQAMVE